MSDAPMSDAQATAAPPTAVCKCGQTFRLMPENPRARKCPACRSPNTKGFAARVKGRKPNLRHASASRAMRREPDRGPVEKHRGSDGRGDPLHTDPDYTAEETEFMLAVERSRREKRRPVAPNGSE
jgi:hypothetical protein